ncbi:hypothetical protein NBH19_08985 [Rhizobium sp. S95]|uniref:Uncharacterized protein n=1 Tax=Ciceribacter sichuanensis TaxID=2949647 RepID=A0AAJ1F785_9HYPH|nr:MULTISPECIES: hypothetical protein [unclassified Ciceribacter]MCM2396212.1 hypothetical protein [Ciceribacter sp. S95]MCO5957637.1 hypothetical protein [Ciceribacter sp. S101]
MRETINLYIDLEEGKLADLEVVARASIAFAEAVKEIAYIVDPSLSIRLEIESGTEGSLSINSVIKTIKDTVVDKVTAKVIIYLILGWFAKETASTVWAMIVEDAIKSEPQLSDQDAEKVAKKVQELLDAKVGERKAAEVVKQLEKDKAVKGVGVGVVKGARPHVVVPRDKFSDFYKEKQIEEVAKERTTRERMTLTIISPVLQENHNKWRFLSRHGMISADVADEAFVASLVRGEIMVPMKGGIMILAEVDNKEKFVDGVWVVQGRTITHVVSIDTGGTQTDLFPKD